MRGERRDPRWEERRMDDSDIDWGDEDEVEEVVVSAKAKGKAKAVYDSDGMDVEDLDMEVLKSFVRGMSVDGHEAEDHRCFFPLRVRSVGIRLPVQIQTCSEELS